MGMESSKDSRIKTIKIQGNSTIFEFSIANCCDSNFCNNVTKYIKKPEKGGK